MLGPDPSLQFFRAAGLGKEEPLPLSEMDAKDSAFEFQVISIVGEQVSLVPTGLSPGETAIVEFDTYYVPDGMSDETKAKLRKAMKHIFSRVQKDVTDKASGLETDTQTRDPIPPCDQEEKDLVLQSLLHRKTVLQQQLFKMDALLFPEQLKSKILALEQQGKLESMLRGKEQTPLRRDQTLLEITHLEHWRRLDKFLKEFEANPACVNLEGVTDADIVLDLNDETVKELLKQFVFFLLQGSHPLPDYLKTDPTSSAFVSRLQKKPLGDKFPPFLDAYKAKRYPIPPAISKVLEATDLDPQSMSTEVKRLVEEERKKILQHIHRMIPSTDPFWTIVKDPNDLPQIFDLLYEWIQGAEEERTRLESDLAEAIRKAKACEQAKAALLADQARMKAQIAELEERLKSLEASDEEKATLIATLQAEEKDADVDLKRKLEDLDQQLKECNEEKAALLAQVDRLTFENQDLMQEIYKQRNQLEDLEDLKTAAEANVVKLRQDHAAAIAVEQARTAEKEAAREAAVNAAEDATSRLAVKTTELATTRASLEAANKLVVDKDATIGELQKQLAEQEAVVAKLREDLKAKTEESASLATQLAAAQTRVRQLMEALDEIQAMADEIKQVGREVVKDLQEANAEIDRLKAELAAEQTTIQDVEIALKKCEEEKKALAQSADGATTSTAQLQGKLRAAEEERAAAQAKVQQQEADVKRLKDQLAEETRRRQSAETQSAQDKAASLEKNAKIQALEGDLASKDAGVGAASQRAASAEAKVKQMEGQLTKTVTEADARITKTKQELEAQFQQALKATQDEFQQTLRQQKNDLTTKLTEAASTQVKAAKEESEAAFEAQKKQYQKALSTVKAIGDWIQSGEESDLDAAITTDASTPEKPALDAIVERLQTSDTTPSSPTGISVDSTVNSCYLVFLESYLWKIAFPPPPSPHPEPGSPGFQDYKRKKLVHDLLIAVFDGGRKPSPEMWATSTAAAASSYTFRSGVYSAITTASSGAKTKAEFGGHLQEQRTIVRRVLSILGKLARAIESGTEGPVSGLDSLDQVYLRYILGNFRTFLTEYKEAYSEPPTFDAETQFPDVARGFFTSQFPSVSPDLLSRGIRQEATGVKVVSAGRGAGQGGILLTYPVLFYSFLVVLRDYLNHIEGTVARTCPLPPFLKAPRPK